MKILLAVDVQKEFADSDGKYQQILDFVKDSIYNKTYDKVIATKCLNHEKSVFVKYSEWRDLIGGAENLEFVPDIVIEKISYGLTDYTFLPKNSKIHIVGYNTGACVLKIALDLFDRDYNFEILSDYCYSSSGEEHHQKGLWTLRNLMKNALK